ncbi:O-methyltransferase [Occultella glacieicola]|uniref:O-methyltransferase n=1 Tax=Occultella glacieicola TaxID=2518684 RepID=A0ABY2E143_9MICO|nr:O-methyltransferase [Occultella glacieicola]TDE90434.1 O-methyltransferase [Occultella glacieicola]
MDTARWTEVDRYFADRLRPRDRVLTESVEAGSDLPQIQVSDLLGGLLGVLARTVSARRVLEVGTLFGYSTIHLARALPVDGALITLEYSPEHARIARENIERAGLQDLVEVRVGSALETLPGVAADIDAPFDLVFIDADKQNNPGYLDWALRLTRPGGLIVVDNVVRGGAVTDPQSDRPDVRGTRAMVDALATLVAEQRVDATALQTVGSKGYDGIVLAYVR